MAADTDNKLPFHKRHPTLVRVVLLSLTTLASLFAAFLYATWALICRGSNAQYNTTTTLERYLNHIYRGRGAYGVETASKGYFGKTVRDLNLAEAATLAALPKAPARYNPVRFPERAIQRRNTVLGLMRQNGFINDADASRAKAYPLQLANKSVTGETAPYFVEWVRQQLDAQFGKQLCEHGLKVYTTRDLDIHSSADS